MLSELMKEILHYQSLTRNYRAGGRLGAAIDEAEFQTWEYPITPSNRYLMYHLAHSDDFESLGMFSGDHRVMRGHVPEQNHRFDPTRSYRVSDDERQYSLPSSSSSPRGSEDDDERYFRVATGGRQRHPANARGTVHAYTMEGDDEIDSETYLESESEASNLSEFMMSMRALEDRNTEIYNEVKSSKNKVKSILKKPSNVKRTNEKVPATFRWVHVEIV